MLYTLLLVLKSSTNQQSQRVHFAKLYKIALIGKSSDHYIAFTHQEVLPCERKKKKKKVRKETAGISNTGEKHTKCKL